MMLISSYTEVYVGYHAVSVKQKFHNRKLSWFTHWDDCVTESCGFWPALSESIRIEGLCERTEHLYIYFSAHHSAVFYFQCSVYWWKGVSDFSA